ncbi:MAG TPA: FkbM family methyltransferase [Solirubrobacteraceae bacterium]|nr:FkbM family methyltransferase [Solirubrobacteraceae bacterium]
MSRPSKAMMSLFAKVLRLNRKLVYGWRVAGYGDRLQDRFRILLLTGAMPLIRRLGGGRRVLVWLRLGDQVVGWTADNFADIGVVDEVFGERVYDLDLVPAPATIIDLGSHVGASVLFFAQIYPGATIVAIEADPGNFRKLHRNVGHLSNVRLVHAAAGTGPGRVTLFASGGVDSWKSSTRQSTPWQSAVEVDSVALDDVLDWDRAERPVMVKIDIEGGEYDVLRAFRSLPDVSAVVGEVHPYLMDASVDDFRTLLADFDLDLPATVEADTTFRARRAPVG